jgi:hypothetical protein
MWAPKIEQTEALKKEISYFCDCIIQRKQPINDAIAGWRVVRLIEAASQSMKLKGERYRSRQRGPCAPETHTGGRAA